MKSGIRSLHGENSVGTGGDRMLSHRPDVFRYAAAQKIDVVLAGHTHGGQVIIPVPRREKGISIANIVSKYTYGWDKRKSSRMYVNRGVGLTFLPWRLHCPPEIAIIKLSAPADKANRRLVKHWS